MGLLLSISCLLMLLPWAARHPLFLLFPVGAAWTPVVGGFVRQMYSEAGLALLALARTVSTLWRPRSLPGGHAHVQHAPAILQAPPQHEQYARGLVTPSWELAPLPQAGRAHSPMLDSSADRSGSYDAADAGQPHPLAGGHHHDYHEFLTHQQGDPRRLSREQKRGLYPAHARQPPQPLPPQQQSQQQQP